MRNVTATVLTALVLAGCSSDPRSAEHTSAKPPAFVSPTRVCVIGNEKDKKDFGPVFTHAGFKQVQSCLPGKADLVIRITREPRDCGCSIRVRLTAYRNVVSDKVQKPLVDASSTAPRTKGETDDAIVHRLIQHDGPLYTARLMLMDW